MADFPFPLLDIPSDTLATPESVSWVGFFVLMLVVLLVVVTEMPNKNKWTKRSKVDRRNVPRQELERRGKVHGEGFEMSSPPDLVL